MFWEKIFHKKLNKHSERDQINEFGLSKVQNVFQRVKYYITIIDKKIKSLKFDK